MNTVRVAISPSLAFRNTVGYRRFDDEYWVAEFLDVTPPSRVNRGFLYFKHHRYPVANQAELSGHVRLGVTHDYDQIGRVRARGFEAELAGLVTSAWQVTLGYGFTDATFVDYFTSAGVNLSGNTPRRAPAHTVTFSTSYAWRNGLSLTAGGQLVSDQFINDTNSVGFNACEVIDVGASYTRGRIQYALNMMNVTDRQYWTSSLGNRQLYPGQPFNVLATVRVRTN